ncbi:hypothetical protein Q7A_03460 [Methylophaga nitratireducenticrescens]|nr:hypothetical protein Q7A_03460 [Methylophaga nitratireducenticrescens]AUZ84237.1 hypothetical protein CDW43_06450 [Methylophaga nitratireducenticrescens]
MGYAEELIEETTQIPDFILTMKRRGVIWRLAAMYSPSKRDIGKYLFSGIIKPKLEPLPKGGRLNSGALLGLSGLAA